MKAGKNKARKFAKQQILQSAQYTPLQKDVLNIVLKNDESYTLEQVNKLIEEFAKRKVG